MKYQWADGFHPPKGVSAEAFCDALHKLPEPTPEALLKASKKVSHIYHEAIWSEGDDVWARKGRLDFCRRSIASCKEVAFVGGQEVLVRSVEYVHVDGDGRWATMDMIRSDKDLLAAYFEETKKLMYQATAKMERISLLMKE
jgi:hypothetical protein